MVSKAVCDAVILITAEDSQVSRDYLEIETIVCPRESFACLVRNGRRSGSAREHRAIFFLTEGIKKLEKIYSNNECFQTYKYH